MTTTSERVTSGLSVERLAAIVQGAPLTADDRDALARDESWQRAERHGVAELLADRLLGQGELNDVERARLTTLSTRKLIVDLGHEAQLKRCLDVLGAAGIDAVLMKGTPLAYTHYARPDLRPRLDTDIVIAASQRTAAHETLVGAGYEPDVQASADLVLHQRTYVKPLAHGLAHVVDLHWRVVNPQVFGGVLSFHEMRRDAVAIDVLGAHARGLSPVHALLVACVHRVAHHLNADKLVWLLDIHLIAERFGEPEWIAFTNLAAERGVASVCRSSLQAARAAWATTLPRCVDDLARAATDGAEEATAGYLQARRAPITAVVDDLRAMPSWSHRWRLVKDYAFPPVQYMREVYAPSSASPLAWLYLRRMVFGARRWLVHS